MFDTCIFYRYTLYYIWKELIYIYIEIQKPNRFKDFLHKIYDRLEDLIFAIIQKFEIINKIHFTT